MWLYVWLLQSIPLIKSRSCFLLLALVLPLVPVSVHFAGYVYLVESVDIYNSLLLKSPLWPGVMCPLISPGTFSSVKIKLELSRGLQESLRAKGDSTPPLCLFCCHFALEDSTFPFQGLYGDTLHYINHVWCFFTIFFFEVEYGCLLCFISRNRRDCLKSLFHDLFLERL